MFQLLKVELNNILTNSMLNVKHTLKIRTYPSLFPRMILIEQRQEMPQVKVHPSSSSVIKCFL